MIKHNGGAQAQLPVRLRAARRDDQQPGRAFRWVGFPGFEVREHPLAEAAARIPEEQQGRAAPEVGKVDALALQVRQAEGRSRLPDRRGREYPRGRRIALFSSWDLHPCQGQAKPSETAVARLTFPKREPTTALVNLARDASGACVRAVSSDSGDGDVVDLRAEAGRLRGHVWLIDGGDRPHARGGTRPAAARIVPAEVTCEVRAPG